MKAIFGAISVFLMVTGALAHAGGGTSANSAPGCFAQSNAKCPSSDYAVIPLDRYEETQGLPPLLNVTFRLQCFQRFVKVIRHDEVDLSTGRTTIAVGALVREDLLSSCESARDFTASAGAAFSGREYSVVSINPAGS